MPGELIPIILVTSFLYCIAYITRVISDNRIRRELINANATEEIVQKLFIEKREDITGDNLKWGIVLVSLGLSLTVIQVTDLSEYDPVTYGLVLIFGGVGLLAYHWLQSGLSRDERI